MSKAFVMMVALFDKAEFRQRNADALSAKVKEEMLKSESELFNEISINLHLIRVGRAGADRFRRKVEDDVARDDFRRAYHGRSHRSFRHFIDELDKAQVASSSRRSGSTTTRPRRNPAPRPQPRPRAPRNNQRRRTQPQQGARQYNRAPYRSTAPRGPTSRPRSNSGRATNPRRRGRRF